MVDLSPSNELVRERLEAVEARVRRLVALVAALDELACLLPNSVEAESVQSVVDILVQDMPGTASDAAWLLQAIKSRTVQIDAILLKSVA